MRFGERKKYKRILINPRATTSRRKVGADIGAEKFIRGAENLRDTVLNGNISFSYLLPFKLKPIIAPTPPPIIWAKFAILSATNKP